MDDVEVEEDRMKPKEKLVVEVEMSGPSGNVFQVMANAREALRRIGCREEAEEMFERVVEAKGYEEALEIIEEYVELRRW